MYLVGNDINHGEYIGFVAMAVVSALLILVHFRYVQNMTITAVYLLPCVAFFICFENSVLAQGDSLNSNSVTAYFTYIFHSLQIPFMVIILYELSYRLFEVRTAHFICLPFDQGTDVSKTLAVLSLWLVRLIACGLFVLSMVVDFRDGDKANMGGYIYLSKNRSSLFAWLTLVPPMVLSIMAIVVADAIARYGSHLTIALAARNRWKILFVCAAGQVVGHIFDKSVYALTSNAGELLLLVGITYSVHLVEEDLLLAGEFADYLHRSNLAFDHQHEEQQHEAGEEISRQRGPELAL